MKSQLIQFLLLVVLLASCESKEIHKAYYEDGTLKEQYTLRNGVSDGAYKALYSNGVPRAIGEFKKGKTHGEWRYFYPHGAIQSIQMFHRGTLTNLNAWDKQGVKIVDDGYGTAVLFYENGDTMSLMSFADNKLHGKYETWFGNGQNESEQYYEYDEPIGVWYFWDEQGKLTERLEY